MMLQVFIYDAQNRIAKNANDALVSFANADELGFLLKGVTKFSRYPAVNVKELRKSIAAHQIQANGYAF